MTCFMMKRRLMSYFNVLNVRLVLNIKFLLLGTKNHTMLSVSNVHIVNLLLRGPITFGVISNSFTRFRFDLYFRVSFVLSNLTMAMASSQATDQEWCKDGLESLCESIGDLVESFSEKGDCSNQICDQGNNNFSIVSICFLIFCHFQVLLFLSSLKVP